MNDAGTMAQGMSRCCQVCGDDFVQGPTALDRERFERAICGGCDLEHLQAIERHAAERHTSDTGFTQPVIVSPSAFAAFEDAIEHPPAATPALRDLFNDCTPVGDPLEVLRQGLANGTYDGHCLFQLVDNAIAERDRMRTALLTIRRYALAAVDKGLPLNIWMPLADIARDALLTSSTPVVVKVK